MPAFSIAIEPVQNLGGAVSFPVSVIIEEAGQVFAEGTPVMISSADGGVKAWDGVTITNGIAGFSREAASNLGTTGSGAPVGFSPVLGPGSVIGSYAANPNQPLANITPPGVPINDGRIGFWVAGPGTVFVGKLGNAGAPAATAAQNVGAQYGLTKDPVNAFWYVDTSKTGANAVALVVLLDPRDAVGTVGGRVWFVILPGSAQSLA
jgi:hypothetical protein